MAIEIEKTEQAPRWLRITIYAQILIGAIAVSISILAAREVRPLLVQRDELKGQVNSLNSDVKNLQGELMSYRQALNAARDGINEYHAGHYDAAVRSYDSALVLDPGNAYLLDLKGYSLFKAGKLEESVNTLHKSVEADPQYAWGYLDLARSYCAIGRFPEASKAAKTAIGIDSGIRERMQSDGEFRRLCKSIAVQFLQ